jgi:hypothetical protein
VFRTSGSYGYNFADELFWEVGPGGYVLLNDDYSLFFAARLSGEFKDKDRFRGSVENDTRRTSLFLGPEVSLEIGSQLQIKTVVDFALENEASGFQSVPDYRVIFHLNYRFRAI